jgi:adenylosuccinate lyase
VAGTVGSITMPHKRNPEIAEHLGTLARLIRSQANALAESQAHEHERDGRSWKTEWAILGPVCGMTGALLRLSKALCANLVIDRARMAANLEATGGAVLSENVMLALAGHLGRQTAHELVYQTAMAAAAAGKPFRQALLEQPEITRHLPPVEIDQLLDYRRHTGTCPQFVDRVAASVQAARLTDEQPLE